MGVGVGVGVGAGVGVGVGGGVVVVGRATRCAWIHSSHGAAKSMAPLVMNQRVDLGSSWKAIGSWS